MRWAEVPHDRIQFLNGLRMLRSLYFRCGHGLDKQAPGGGYFIFRNSWGAEFAERGYARLTFAYARQYGIDAYIASIR